MWQLFAVGSLVAQALQGVADKAALVRDTHIHIAIATFWRQAMFLFFVTVVAYMGWLGELTLFFSWHIVALGAIAAVSAYAYTYVLRRIEVTGVFIEQYLAPIIFLGIDIVIIEASLTAAQIAGIIILTAGGFALAFNARTHHLKREFSPLIWGIFLFWMVFDGAQFYLFKHLHETQALNEVSFLTSVWLVNLALVFVYIVLIGKTHLLFGREARKYIPAVSISKGFDAASAILWMHALTFAAVSQVTALSALEPIILFFIALIVQKETRFNIRERVDRANISWKLGAVTMLGFGILLVS